MMENKKKMDDYNWPDLYRQADKFIMTMWRILPLLKWRDESMHFLLFLQKYQITAKMLPYKRRGYKR